MAGVSAVGFLIGVIVELCIDTNTIQNLQEQNRKLRLENKQLRQETKREVIEIIDNRTSNDEVKFGGF